MAYTYPLRSACDALREGSAEGSEQRTGKDWGGPAYTVHPLPGYIEDPAIMHGVVRGDE